MTVEEITKQTYNSISESYSSSTFFPTFRKIIENSINVFTNYLPEKAHVLILGSGDGRDALILSKLGYSITMVDYSKNMLRLSQRLLPDSKSILMDFRELDFEEFSFHGVWASTCLYHVRKMYFQKIVDDVFSILKKNGVFYFNLKYGKGEQLIQNPRSYPYGGARFYSFYNKEELKGHLAKFRLIKIEDDHPEIDIPYLQFWLRK